MVKKQSTGNEHQKVTLALVQQDICYLKDNFSGLKTDIKEIKDLFLSGEGKISANRTSIVEIQSGVKVAKWVAGFAISLLGLAITYVSATQ